MKRRLLLWACLLLIVGGLTTFCYFAWRENWLQTLWEKRPSITKVEPGYYRVTHVYDGDTIQVDMDGTLEKVRFIGVDTPETHDPDVSEQCYGSEATNFTTDLLLDHSVRLESDPTNSNRDRYERVLRYVYTSDNELVNKKLIELGYGFAYVRFPFIKRDEFLEVETTAKNTGLGLWGGCTTYINNGVYQTTAR